MPVAFRLRLRPWYSRLNGLLALTLLGTGIATYLAWVALNEDEEAFCSGVGDCHAVQSSEYAEIGGMPIAVLGLGMYVALLGIVILRHSWQGEAPNVLRVWTFTIALSGVMYSAYLTYLEAFEIEAICVWCVASAVVVTLIMVLAIPDLRAGSSRSDARTV